MSKILIVDDEVGMRDFCYEIFKEDGHQMLTAPTGAQAISLVVNEKPDLVLMDLNLAGESGIDILKKMPKREGCRIPTIIFSGFVTPELETQAFEAGVADVIQKGVGIDELKGRVNKILSGKHALSDHPPVKGEEETVLIVDDEENIIQLLTHFFKSKGYRTLSADNGETAITILERENPQIVLLDVMMPGMDGLVTLKKMRAINPDVGVVMVTGNVNEQIAKEASSLGCYHYVLKPFDFKYLELVVMSRLVMAS